MPIFPGLSFKTPFPPPYLLGTCILAIDGNNPTGDGIQPADGTALTNWQDLGPVGTNSPAQATAIRQPAFKANVKNGKGAILFSGSQWMDTGTINFVGKDATLFIVCNRTAGSLLTGDNNATLDTQNTKFQIDGNNTTVGSLGMSSTFKQYTLLRQSGASKAFINGVQSGSTLATALADLPSSIYCVGTRALDRSSPFSGNICELIIYNRLLSVGEQLYVQSYLKSKWGT